MAHEREATESRAGTDLEALAALTRPALAAQAFDPWLEGALPSVAALAGADAAAALFAGEDGQLRLAAVWGLVPAAGVADVDFGRLPGALQRAWREGRPTVAAVPQGERTGAMGGGDLACYASVPIPGEDWAEAGDASGVLAVAWRQSEVAPDAATLSLLTVAARHIGQVRQAALARLRLEQAERARRRAHHLHAVLSQANQAVVRARDPDELLREVCAAIAGYPGVGLCWIGWLDEESASLRPAVWAGKPAAFARGLHLGLGGPGLGGPGLAARALREGVVQVVDDLTAEARPRPNQKRAIAAGFRSWAVAPVRDGARRGLLSLNASEPGFFQAEDRQLLAELAGDVEYGLAHLRAQSDRARGETALRAVFDTVQDGLLLMDDRGRIELANPALAKMFGRDLTELVGHDVTVLMTGPDRERAQARMHEGLQRVGPRPPGRGASVVGQRADGSAFPAEIHIGEAPTPYGRRFVGVVRDMTREHQRARERDHVLSHDPLTGLWNRTALQARLEVVAAQARTPALERVALVLVDLDAFQYVNERHGPQGADAVLVAVARRLEAAAGPRGFVARVGGDEFGVIVPAADTEAVAAWTSLTLRSVGRGVRVEGGLCRPRASAGAALLPDDGPGADAVLARAGLALHVAKAEGGGTIRLFTRPMEQHEERVRALPDRLRQAAGRGELLLHYQPQVNMVTGEVRAFEALLRWQDPERGLLLPGEFLPLLRDRETIVFLGEWVIDAALRQWQAWRSQGIAARVAVNVAAQHFLDPGFAHRLRRRLAALGEGARDALEVEITESAAIADTDRGRAVMEALKALGVTLALDDFGTGYASIAYLSALPFDAIKIDLSFTRHMLDTAEGWAIAHAILLMGVSAEREVVAEGIETATTAEGLMRLGTRFGQGYLFGRPMAAGAVAAWLARWRLESLGHADRADRRTAEADYMTAIHLHLRWVSRLLTALRHPGARSPAADLGDQERCAFVRWCGRYGEGRESVTRLAQIHVEAHRAARALAMPTPTQGRSTQALEAELLRETERFLAAALEAFYPTVPAPAEA